MVKRGFILLAFFLFTVCLQALLVKETKFDKSYKVINRERLLSYENSNGKKIYKYFLYCNNELGTFKIDVNEETYNSKPYGSMVRFNEPFSSFEMYDYAVNETSEKNVLKALDNKRERFFVEYQFVGVLCIVFSILLPTLIIIMLLSIYKYG